VEGIPRPSESDDCSGDAASELDDGLHQALQDAAEQAAREGADAETAKNLAAIRFIRRQLARPKEPASGPGNDPGLAEAPPTEPSDPPA